MVTTYCLELTRYLTEAEYESFKSLAGPLKQKRLPQYEKYQDAQRSLCGDLLLLYILNDKFGLKTSLASIRNGSYGKPCIQSPITIEYNLSHSGSWVVGCVSNGAPVGIDVETAERAAGVLCSIFPMRKKFILRQGPSALIKDSIKYGL